jgi:hypothetical protein
VVTIDEFIVVARADIERVIVKPGTWKRALHLSQLAALRWWWLIANGSPTSAFMVRSFRRTGHG